MIFLQKPVVATITALARCKIYILETFLAPVALLAIRLYVGHFYWQSGQTKFANLDSARTFSRQNIFPTGNITTSKCYPASRFLSPCRASNSRPSRQRQATSFSALLIVGFAGRLPPSHLMMTLAIEMFVYPGTDEHYYWMLPWQ